MRRFLDKANHKFSIGWAAALLAGSALLANLLGLLRERLLLANFGVGAEVDAYKAAFAVPDFMFFLLVSGALSVTFIPVFTERMVKGNRKSAWELSASLLNFMAIITGVVSLLIIIFAQPLLEYFVAPGLSDAATSQAVIMMRIIALNPFLFSISSVLTSVQQATGRFFFYAMAPSVYNLGIIFGILAIAPQLGIEGVAYGVFIGSVAQMLVAILGMKSTGFKYKPQIFWKNRGFIKVLTLLPARSVDQGLDYFNSLVGINIASKLQVGAITAYSTAFTLHLVPVGLIGIAISTAAFPKMSERLSQGRPDLFKKELMTILRVIIWLSLPVAVIAFLARGYLVRLLVASGNPTISLILGSLALAVFFRSVFHIMARGFYAQQDTKTPLYISVVAISVNIFLAIWLTRPGAYGVEGLAIAYSITAVLEVLILSTVLSRRLGGGMFTWDFARSISQMVSAAGLSAFVTYVFIAFLLPLRATDVGFFVLVPKFILIIAVSLLTYLLFSYIFRVKESIPVVAKIKDTLFKPITIQQ